MKINIRISLLIILIPLVFSCGNIGPITIFDYPNNIEKEIDTIEVTYIAWACACPNWVGADYIPENNLENLCFFIEAEKESNKLPEKYHTSFLNEKRMRIKLIGSFYKDKGISRDYIKSTSEKPEHARVFRYTKFEVLNLE